MFGNNSSDSIFGGSPLDGSSPFDSNTSNNKSIFDSPSVGGSPFEAPSAFNGNQESSMGLGQSNSMNSLTNLNNRGGNYGGNSVIDAMRGAQARRLNNDGSSASLAEMYGDSSLDTRFAGGAYNVTLSDIYADRTKFEVAMGVQTGMILKDRENEDLGYDGYNKEKDTTKNFSPFSKEGMEENKKVEESPFSKSSIDSKIDNIPKTTESLMESYQRESHSGIIAQYTDKKDTLPFSNNFKKNGSFDEMVEESSNVAHSDYIKEQIAAVSVAGIAGLDNANPAESENKIVQEFRLKSQEEKMKMIKDNKLPPGLPVAEKQKVLSEQKKIEDATKKAEKKKAISDAKIAKKAKLKREAQIEFENSLRTHNKEETKDDKNKSNKNGKIKTKKKKMSIEEAVLSVSGVQRKINLDEEPDEISDKINKRMNESMVPLESESVKKIYMHDDKEDKLEELVSELKKSNAPHVITQTIAEEKDSSKKIERFRQSEIYDYEEETEEVKNKRKVMSRKDILSKILK